LHGVAPLEKLLGRALTAQERDAAAAALARAQAAWPAFPLDAGTFFSQAKLSGELVSELNELHAGDLLLASRCAAADPVAISALDAKHLKRVGAVVRRLDGSGALGEDVAQALREKLLLPASDGRRRIGDFTGKGSLDAWLRAAAVRTALNLRRGKAELLGFEPDAELADHVDLRPDPELRLARATSKKIFAEAFSEAMSELAARDRAVLKLHYLDGLTTQKIALIYGTHRITVTRWLVACRQRLMEQTRRVLEKRLKLDRLELESLLRMAKASFDVSIGQHLRSKG
jgi:RNA polymerase sigma-70 factor (ECF subfamily)